MCKLADAPGSESLTSGAGYGKTVQPVPDVNRDPDLRGDKRSIRCSISIIYNLQSVENII